LTLRTRAVLATAVGVAAVSTPHGAESAPEAASETPSAPRVLVSTTGNQSERIRTIPIARRPGREKRVVMSMKPHEVPDFVPGDRVKVTAEAQFTVNCLNNGFPRCVGPAYHYNPVIRTNLVLARGKETTGGRHAVEISATKRDVCRQRLPLREHHCVITFTKAGFRRETGHPPPCALDSCRINLVADAHNPRAGAGDLLMVGGQRPDGSIPQDRGRVNAIRFHPGDQPKISPVKSKAAVRRHVDPDYDKHVVYSKKLSGLRAGEQLEVTGRIKETISGLPYNTRTSAHLVLTARRHATRSNRTVKRVATLGGEIDELNGFNCTRNRSSCVLRKVGVLGIAADSTQPLFVNLVTIIGPKRTLARPGDRARIAGGQVKVVRYPPGLKG
jgi:hypothetical protein